MSNSQHIFGRLLGATRTYLRASRLRELEEDMEQRLPRLQAMRSTVPDSIRTAWFENVAAELCLISVSVSGLSRLGPPGISA